MSTTPAIAPVRREIRVACDPDTAFDLFTAHIGAWWPLGTHSVFGSRATVAFEDGVLVERLGRDRAVWGAVLDWNRPTGFRMTWHPGQGPERATEVEVAFAGDGDGTLVTLTHVGWEHLAEPEAARAEYDRGWPGVLAGFGRVLDDSADADTAQEWFALHHRPGAALDEGGSIFAHPLFAEHVAFLGRLQKRGWLVAAGPIDAPAGEGMAVVRVPAGSGQVVDELARTDDLSVAGGLLTVSVRPWDVRFSGD
jgi:uncharacterized protein YciI